MTLAVPVQRAEAHDPDAGKWLLDAGFGPLSGPHAPFFDDL